MGADRAGTRSRGGGADALGVELNKEYATLQKADVSGVTQ